MNEKVLSFNIDILGVSNEATELEKITLQLKNLKKEKQELERLARTGFASGEQVRQLAAYSKEIDSHTKLQKELKKVVDSAPDSLNRMRAELIKLKDQYANTSAEVREKMAPAINKLNGEISKQEQAIGVNSRGVGNYKNSIMDATKSMLSFAAPITVATIALNKLKEAFLATEQGAKIMERVSQSTSTFFGLLAQGKVGQAFFGGQVAEAQKLSDVLDKLRIAEREEKLKNAEDETKIKLLRLDAIKYSKDQTKQVELLTQAEKLEDDIITRKKDHLIEEIAVYIDLNKNNPNNTKLLDTLNAKQIELEQLEGERSLRIASKRQTAIDKQQAAYEKAAADKQKLDEDSAKTETENAAKSAKTANDVANQRSKEGAAYMKQLEADYKKKHALEVETDKDNQEFIEKEITRMEKEAAVKLRIDEAYEKAKGDIMNSAANLINAVAGKNKSLQKASLIADKAVAIAEIIIQTRKANAALKAWGALGGPFGFAAAIAASTANNISAGINIAAVIAATVAGLAGFARGGKINRGVSINTGTKDDTLIAVNKTETVLTQDHVQRLGGSAAMRRIKVPGYAEGGYIGQTAPEIPQQGFDMRALASMINAIQVKLDVNKLNNAQSELQVINTTQKI